MIAFRRVRTIYIYIYIYILVREYALYTSLYKEVASFPGARSINGHGA